METRKHIVIVGGGFGGLSAARRLAHRKDLSITVIDRRNHHLFQPLLYQVATAGLSPADIAAPIRSILSRSRNIQVLMSTVDSIDLPSRTLTLHASPSLSYDYLVLACGAGHSYFGHDEWERHAPGLKSLEDATEIRRRILTAFECAEKEKDPLRRQAHQTFVVVGGGPTGVELAGAIGEMSRYTLRRDFRSIDPTHTRILLVEAAPRILSSFPEDLAARATRDLERLGVNVRTNCVVTNIQAEGVHFGEEFIASSCVLWAAGVKASPLNKQLDSELDRQGRVIVKEDLSLPKRPEVFVIGDQAHFKDASTGNPLPGLAPIATQQGHHVAQVIEADLSKKPRPPFHHRDKGQMATIGRKQAVAQSAGLKFKGLTAWIMWLFVHIYYLVGFRNRLLVLLQWAWSYFTFQRGARLIVNYGWRDRLDKSPPSPTHGS